MIDRARGSEAGMAAALISGLARNPAAPPDVLLRMLDLWPQQLCVGLRRRPRLPTQLQTQMEHHPSGSVRSALATHPDVDPPVRARLLADRDWRVRLDAFGKPGQRPLPDEAIAAMLTWVDDPSPEVPLTREELSAELLVPGVFDQRLIRLAAAHPRPGVRQWAAGFPQIINEPTRRALSTDPVPEVRHALAEAEAQQRQLMYPADLPDHHCHAFWFVLQRPLAPTLVDQVLASGDLDAISAMSTNPTLTRQTVDVLVDHPDPDIRRQVALRADLTVGHLIRLAADPSAAVRTAVSVHPGLTEAQRATISIDVTSATDDQGRNLDALLCAHKARRAGPPPALSDALDWARSVNPLLRRRAACSPDLPAEVVTALADNSELGVRVVLAIHHPAAPPALLLRGYLEYTGAGRDRLPQLPQFPVDGLARFADHPDPQVRLLVALDPEADPDLVARLCGDPDPRVRQAMAGCPRLPVPWILALLDDPDLAERAAANPALPVAQMRRVVNSREADCPPRSQGSAGPPRDTLSHPSL